MYTFTYVKVFLSIPGELTTINESDCGYGDNESDHLYWKDFISSIEKMMTKFQPLSKAWGGGSAGVCHF